MASKKDFVKFDKVDKSYDGKVLVVKDLQLDIAEGEFITMLGPSGSGKTTCLMMLAGFETPTNGEIYLDGKAISSIPPHKRGIGMVFQNYALFPHMTVYENLAFPLRVRKVEKDEIDLKMKDYEDAISQSSQQIDIQKLTGVISNDLLKEKLIIWLEENSEVKEKTTKTSKATKTSNTTKTTKTAKTENKKEKK